MAEYSNTVAVVWRGMEVTGGGRWRNSTAFPSLMRWDDLSTPGLRSCAGLPECASIGGVGAAFQTSVR